MPENNFFDSGFVLARVIWFGCFGAQSSNKLDFSKCQVSQWKYTYRVHLFNFYAVAPKIDFSGWFYVCQNFQKVNSFAIKLKTVEKNNVFKWAWVVPSAYKKQWALIYFWQI